ncbi:MAG: class I SAM-dependent methyltransferase [Pseudomonadota bacterium]
MAKTPGTEGYEAHIDAFLAACDTLEFDTVNADFLPFLPEPPARVLDLGAGAGQNAAALVRLGHSVTAVEPLAAFRAAAQERHADAEIHWIGDSLPELLQVRGEFDFILVDGVWQHLNEGEQRRALARISALLARDGRLAISFRHGPAGAGTCVYPIDDERQLREAAALGLERELYLSNQPSLLPNKTAVRWSRALWRRP